MPRPSLKSERRKHILDAFERCVAIYGLEGASLERISEEAGLARPLIRHNIGNRDELVSAFIKDFFSRSHKAVEALIESLPSKNKTGTLIDWLFMPGHTDQKTVLVSSALFMAAANDKSLAKSMRDWTRSFIDMVLGVLKQDFPHHDDAELMPVAVGLSAIYFNNESLVPIGGMREVTDASIIAARSLVQSLEG